ncbi:Rieske (2Fe-2S) protein [candidate division CSSED10-310 bacterium]|uniref:Rieske (2Fe-2S) protein n=1 Tax=candidate division CSSED10-310 bacterium TaxID=2855610 RepID=A0ABV6YU49_UNCC1
MPAKTVKRNFWQLLFGITSTKLPRDAKCWSYNDGRVILDLSRAPELKKPGGAIRMEGDKLPVRILVIHGFDGKFHAFHNSCPQSGRRLDPVPGTRTVQCCSFNVSTYDYQGKAIAGSGKRKLKVYPIRDENLSQENITVFRNILETILSIQIQ